MGNNQVVGVAVGVGDAGGDQSQEPDLDGDGEGDGWGPRTAKRGDYGAVVRREGMAFADMLDVLCCVVAF